MLSIGARPDVQNNDNKTPGEYTTDSSIAALLNGNIILEYFMEFKFETENKFIDVCKN